MSRQPVAAAMRPAAVTPASEPSVSPPRSSTPPGSAAAARAIASSSTRARATRAGTSATPSASPHAQSAGTMSVATPPGGRVAAATASARSPASASALRDVRTQHDTGRAKPSTSASSGAPLPMCVVAWSPTMTTTGVRALAALWRLARPFASPGPRCSRTSAGLPARRP